MIFAERKLDFDRDGGDWPDREVSRFVDAAGLRWHVQDFGGEGPAVLLLHGTGSATHSWRGLVPILRSVARAVAVDLPGHGFTDRPPQKLLSLPGMAAALGDLMQELRLEPSAIIGHSAGAAVMLRMALDFRPRPRALVSINGALRSYGGEAARWLSPLAKLLFLNPLMPRLIAWQFGNAAAVERLIRQTGSRIDETGLRHYTTLVGNADHVAAALGMMANWDLSPLSRDLPTLDVPLLLIAGEGDKAVNAEDVFVVRDRVRQARVELVQGLGHLAHEEAPEAVAAIVLGFLRDCGVLAAS